MRSSILLVEFINAHIVDGVPFKEAVLRSANVRAQPIILTCLAAMVVALFLLSDPTFNGLAVALIFREYGVNGVNVGSHSHFVLRGV